MKFIVIRDRRIHLSEFYEIEGEDYHKALDNFKSAKFVGRVNISDRSTVCSGIQEKEKVDKEWFHRMAASNNPLIKTKLSIK